MNSEKRSVISPFITFTAPISMILFLNGWNPVVSISNTTYEASREAPLLFTTISFKSSTKYPSQPKISLKSSPFDNACAASGKAYAQPWSVMARAVCPQPFAVFTSACASDTASISEDFVWQWSSTRFTRAWSSRFSSFHSARFIPDTEEIVTSWSNLSIMAMPLTVTALPTATSFFNSAKNSFGTKIFAMIVSV